MPVQFFCRVGSKLKLLDKILPLIPPHTKYVEAFVGGGSVFWNKELADKNVINDLDPLLIEGYRLLKSMKNKQPSDFILPNGLKNIQQLVNKPNPTKEERLLQILYMTCNTFGSIGGKKIYKNHTQKNKINKIETYVDKMKNVTITKQDYLKVIKEHDSPNTFFFLDPPYEKSDNLYEDSSIDYEEMNKVLKSLKGKFLLTINDSPLIRKIFSSFIIKKIVARGAGNEGIGYEDRKELIIMNYSF